VIDVKPAETKTIQPAPKASKTWQPPKITVYAAGMEINCYSGVDARRD
jgi:hypothetical protein